MWILHFESFGVQTNLEPFFFLARYHFNKSLPTDCFNLILEASKSQSNCEMMKGWFGEINLFTRSFVQVQFCRKESEICNLYFRGKNASGTTYPDSWVCISLCVPCFSMSGSLFLSMWIIPGLPIQPPGPLRVKGWRTASPQNNWGDCSQFWLPVSLLCQSVWSI